MNLSYFIKILTYFFYDNFKNEAIVKKEISKDMLKWNTIYGFSSFTYGFVGFIMYFFLQNIFTTEQYNVPIPIKYYAICLIIQSFVTFFADVYFINNESIFHNIDRFVALFNILFFSVAFYNISIIEKVIFTIGLINGLYIFKYSRLYRKKQNIELYSYYHTLWHLTFPLYLLIWFSYRNVMIVSS